MKRWVSTVEGLRSIAASGPGVVALCSVRRAGPEVRSIVIAIGFIVLGCSAPTVRQKPQTESSPKLHATCVETRDCSSGATCLHWRNGVGHELRTCEVPCELQYGSERKEACPSPWECVGTLDGPSGAVCFAKGESIPRSWE
jgi:hypothetical protein